MSKICKFFQSGHCSKGAACTFLHQVTVVSEKVSEKERVGMAIYNIVYQILKTCCPDEKIQRIQGKITGMLLEMTPEEIDEFLTKPSYQEQRMEDAFAAIENENASIGISLDQFYELVNSGTTDAKLPIAQDAIEEAGELAQTVKEIKSYKKCLGEIITFFKEKRLGEVDVHLSYTKGTAVKVGLIQMQKPEKKNNYTFVVPGDSKEEREFCMNLVANDRFFQNNVRKGLSQYCPQGYFTMKYIETIQAVAIQATRRY